MNPAHAARQRHARQRPVRGSFTSVIMRITVLVPLNRCGQRRHLGGHRLILTLHLAVNLVIAERELLRHVSRHRSASPTGVTRDAMTSAEVCPLS